ncbi:zinc finger protein ZFP2-like [Topomyia yanbarensis]|uniref:zinc finger protein ZFP2-like n=1 Tax=Topomyia yanbarensis TaxID=2498891 RepID=UPI00273B8B9B|nr:zinc finger protein ZFP2-like [Topomyia yanbarensis]
MNSSYLPKNELSLEAQLTAAVITADALHCQSVEQDGTALTEPPHTSDSSVSDSPTIVYLDRVCRTCLVEKEKDQLKDLFEFGLAETVMECVSVTIEEADGLPCHICVNCLQEVERICNFRQQCERSDASIRNLIEKSVVITQDSATKYEVLNVVLTDSDGNTETSAVVVPIEELRFQLMNGGSTITTAIPESMNMPIEGINKTVQFAALEELHQTNGIGSATPETNLHINFSVPTMLVEEECIEEASAIMNPSELLNDQTVEPESLQQEESEVLENLKKELSEFIGNIPKEPDLDDNDDDEMIHVDYLKDALTEEYIQSMEKQLASSVTRSDDPIQERLEQENMASLINDEDRILAGDRNLQQCLADSEFVDRESNGESSLSASEFSKRRCKICDMDFESNRHYHNHMKRHSEKRFECPHCPRKYSEKFVLKNHMLRHTGEKMHACDKCDARFYQKNMLNVHKRRHSNERRYNCDSCEKRFKSKSLLNTHNKIHLGEKSHVCQVCGKGFTLSWQLKAHTRIHTNEKPYECQYCQKRFNQKGNLMIHVRIHTGERPFQCALCEKAYPSQGELSGHMRQHTGEKKAKNIVCTVCQKAFAGKGDLKIHMRTHTKEKPYSCQVCGKSFMLHVHLTVHMRSHTGEKPFTCTMCQKAFATNYQLKNHTYVHTGEKNYACDICDRRFSSSANKNTHQKTHDRKIS